MKSWEGLGSNWHNGIGQGGNKSFCAYRLGFGVPGYTGFVPVSENIAIPVKKASAERAPLDRGHGDHGDGGALTMSKSTTRKDYSLTPANFAIATMPNKLWDNKAPRPVGDPPFIRRPVDDRERPFFARSTFQDAYEEGLAPKPYPENVTQTGHLRPPNVGAPADDRDPFFTSESNLKTTQTAELAAAQLDRHFVPPVAVKQRANPQLRGVGLRHRPPSTTYRDSFGLYGSDPQSKMARTPTGLEGQSMLGSTSLDFQGTTKATLHPPGYVGFIPETGRRARPPSPLLPASLPSTRLRRLTPPSLLRPQERARVEARDGDRAARVDEELQPRDAPPVPEARARLLGVPPDRADQYLRPRAQRGGDVARPRQHCGDVRLRAPRPGHLDVDARREGAAAVGPRHQGADQARPLLARGLDGQPLRERPPRGRVLLQGHAPLRGPLRRDHQGARHLARGELT